VRLPRPFFRLPVRFDVARLRAEVDALPAECWAPHPNRIPGNTCVRLISAEGGENDDTAGRMLPTPHLERLPYVRQILASFGVVWSRSRLLRLAPAAGVPQHSDINHHWFYRVRVHVPVRTRPEVRFHCDAESVHMAAGEAWVFDNWRQHSVENPTEDHRIHLVADTSGNAAFWNFVARSDAVPEAPLFAFDPAIDARPLTERTLPPAVMPPAEVDFLVGDLRGELAARDASPALAERLNEYHGLLASLCQEWRHLYSLFGDDPAGREAYEHVRDTVRTRSRTLADGLVMRSNRVAAHQVLEGRVLRALLHLRAGATSIASPGAAAGGVARDPTAPAPTPRLRPSRPVFIVAAPRSGSTLLFETLAASDGVCTLGGEGHWLVEGLPQLRPGAPGVESNRLLAEHATPEAIAHFEAEIAQRAQDAQGRPVAPGAPRRFVEKTPKNVLRIPFLARAFPDALFVFLWRDPRDNLSSIVEAWRSGRWKTYNGLEGFDGPWSLLLPPGWRAMNGRPLEEIAAFQWESANRIALDDLERLPRGQWTSVRHEDLVADPARTVRRLCDFAGLEFDAALAERVGAPLPPSRHTQTPPAPDKWKRNEAEIARVLPSIDATWARLRALG
jgi:hypothetical protein